MRCLTISTAETYNLQGLALALDDVEFINFYTDTLHASYKEWDIFIFRYGCIAFWNVPEEEEFKFLKHIQDFSDLPINSVQEKFNYSFGSKPKFSQDKITL